MTDRILYNAGRKTIDEIVVHNCTVHIEQMNDIDWWIGIDKADGTRWMGDFFLHRGRLKFNGEADGEWHWDEEREHGA